MKDKTEHYMLYVLYLEDHNFYVGVSSHPRHRIENHINGTGARWTQAHKPLKVLELHDLGVMSYQDAGKIEKEKTLNYIDKYGVDKVRGGAYCMVNPPARMKQLMYDLSQRRSLSHFA